MPLVKAISIAANDRIWRIDCPDHEEHEYMGDNPICVFCADQNMSMVIQRKPFTTKHVTGLPDWDDLIERATVTRALTKPEVEQAVRRVLLKKRSALFGRSSDIKSKDGLERAVEEYVRSIAVPVLQELDLMPADPDNVVQGTLDVDD